MARMGEIQFRGDGSDPKQVFNYMLQLEEQIKYALAHIGEENIEPGSIEMEQFGPVMKQSVQQITFDIQRQEAKSRQLASEDGRLQTLIITTEQGIMAQMTDMEEGLRGTITATAADIITRFENTLGDYSTTQQTAQQIATYVTNALGDYSTTTQTAQQIASYVSSALGDYSTTQQTAQLIASYVSSALGDYSTTQQTAQQISAYVESNAYQQVSGISITAQGIDMTGSEHINLGSGGLITIGTGFVAGLSRTQIRALDIYSTRMSGYVDMTTILEDLDWYGWIRNASVSGNTLTLTKSNGGTVSFTPSGGSSYTLPTGLEQLANVLESVSYANNRLVLYMTGNNTITLYNGTHNAD